MPFIDDILKYKSLSIVGMEKNTGKTECLNYVLQRLKNSGKKIAITSIGIDGESVDQVTETAKPEIELYENIVFVTSEKHYKERKLISEILDISERSTSIGRLITAKSLSNGKIIFSGPSDTIWLKNTIDSMQKYGIDTTIVDGALSRLSLSSPAVTESMILSTGAAVSANISQLVKKTKFVYNLINIEEYKSTINDKLLQLENGLWSIDSEGNIYDLDIPSVFLLEQKKEQLFRYGNTIYATGAISDKLLNFLRIQKNIEDIVLIVKDFTKIFVSHEAYNAFIKRGGKIKVLLRTKLIAVCINPTSPQGYNLNSKDLQIAIADSLQIPVYDVKKL